MGWGFRTACAASLALAGIVMLGDTAPASDADAAPNPGSEPAYVIAPPPALAPLAETVNTPSELTTASLGETGQPRGGVPSALHPESDAAPVTAAPEPATEQAPLVIAPVPEHPGDTPPLVETVLAEEAEHEARQQADRLAEETRRAGEEAVRLADEAQRAALAAIEQETVREGIRTALAQRLAQPGWAPPRITATLATEIAGWYAERDHAPLWYDGLALNAAGRALMARLARAREDGLGPYDAVTIRAPEAGALAAAELRLTAAAVLFARDARGGRIDPRQLSRLITPKLDLPAPTTVLAALATAATEGADTGAVLAGYLPRHEGYVALRDKLAKLRAEAEARADETASLHRNRVPEGTPLRIGMRDPRVPLLRARFGLGPETSETYDRALATRVAEFQRERGLPGAGVLNSATTAALNGARTDRTMADIIAVMERWRWLPDDLGEEHIIVNVPAFSMRKIEQGATVHESRVIVGRPERPTPIFSDRMDHLVLNPSWTVPPTILREDYLPKLAADPGYAERKGLQVIRRGDRITLRQPPGPTNALGVVKFMFPNDHAVYLHDTPNRSQFAHERRAYSSGCVRVERPLRLAELVLGGPETGWSEQRLRSLVGSGERTIRLNRQLPIHLVYMTHVVDADGRLVTHDDLYGFHRMTRAALGL